MAKISFKIPTDKQIWAEVDARLETIPSIIKARGQFDRNKLFEEKKRAYKEMPKRLAAEKKQNEIKAKAQAKADLAYIELRKKQGKQIVTQKELAAKFPKIVELSKQTLSIQQVQEWAEMLDQLSSAQIIQKKITRVHSVSRKLLFDYLTQAYGLYRRIRASEVADKTFQEIRATLLNKLKIKTHDDIPQASILLKLVFRDVLDKTIHLYSRAFQLADGYNTEAKDFPTFIKELGGMEKIRKAYATVIAADLEKIRKANATGIATDSGKKQSFHKKAEHFASLQAVDRMPVVKSFKLSEYDESSFSNDPNYGFLLLLAKLDHVNSTLDVLAKLPVNRKIEGEIFDFISAVESKRNSSSWHQDKKDHLASHNRKALKKLIASYNFADAEVVMDVKKKPKVVAKKIAAIPQSLAKQRAKA